MTSWLGFLIGEAVVAVFISVICMVTWLVGWYTR